MNSVLRLNLEIKCECAFNKEEKRIKAAPYIKHMKLEGLECGWAACIKTDGKHKCVMCEHFVQTNCSYCQGHRNTQETIHEMERRLYSTQIKQYM